MPTPSDESRPEGVLLMRARNGDTQAFGDLVGVHQRRLWRTCRQYLGPDEADAAVQDALVKAFAGIASFDGRAAFSTWLTRIAINTCIDALRRRRREGTRVSAGANTDLEEAQVEVADEGAGPEARAMQREALAVLAACEGALPPRQREIFRLRFYAELELDEIAAALGVHVGTVKTQLHRAVHRLRRELGGVR